MVASALLFLAAFLGAVFLAGVLWLLITFDGSAYSGPYRHGPWGWDERFNCVVRGVYNKAGQLLWYEDQGGDIHA